MSIWGKAKHFLIYVKYMIPSLFDLSVYSICSIISGIMTSKWIGTTAMGAVSVASPYISFIYAYGLIFGVGGSTVISIHRGRGDESTAKEVFSLNIACMTATTILISLAAFVFTKQLASLLGATPENTKYVVQYSQSSKFKGRTTKTVTINNNKTGKTVLKGLTSGKNYYVRVRSCKVVNGKEIWGAYSKATKMKVK